MDKLRAMGLCVLGAAVLLAAPAASAQKKSKDGPPPPQVTNLLNCRNIADGAERLACFDRAAATISEAVASRDIVVVDRESMRRTKGSLFGFSVPEFGGIFGGGDDEIKEVEGLVESVGVNRDGGWTIRLQDGSTWTQIDSTVVPLEPKRGEKAVIRRAALGSFFMKVGKQPGFRAKRIG